MDLDNEVSTILASLRLEAESDDLVQSLYQFEDFYERKLWHQLTLALEEFYGNPSSRINGLRTKIYDSFVSQFSQKLNPIMVVDFLLMNSDNKEELLAKLVTLKSKFLKEIRKAYSNKADDVDAIIQNDEALIYTDLQIARFQLLLDHINDAVSILDEVSPKFESTYQSRFSSKINAAYYLTKCQHYKIMRNYNAFYPHALLYLSSVDLKELSLKDKQLLCFDLSISALLGDKIYNFGELILHEIMTCLKDSEYQWLYDLVHFLNAGSLHKFNELLPTAYTKAPFLKQYDTFLKQKIIIMSLLELISLKPTSNNILKFKEIADFTGTPVDEVEYLIIKCLSLNLIKGQINQIEQILIVSWLQPRILNLDQVSVLYSHLCSWNEGLDDLSNTIEKQATKLWTSV